MAEPETGWNWLETSPRSPAGADDHIELARACARVFSGIHGERVTAHLKALTLGRCLGPDASDAALRSLEGQRQLVLHLLSLAAQGRGGF